MFRFAETGICKLPPFSSRPKFSFVQACRAPQRAAPPLCNANLALHLLCKCLHRHATSIADFGRGAGAVCRLKPKQPLLRQRRLPK